MMQYRKKPVVIEAMQYDGSYESYEAAMHEFGPEHLNWLVSDLGILVHTLEGTMTASPGDWIIRGVQGEVYPCKPDIFLQTYEPV